MTDSPYASSRITYYQARNDLQIDGLPFFFGRVNFEGGKISGEHYKPKIDQSTKTHLIGYYKIEGDAADFLQSFEKHGLSEITQEEFNVLLSGWTRGGKYPPICWGLGAIWEIAKPS
jgi:hypothetical protein